MKNCLIDRCHSRRVSFLFLRFFDHSDGFDHRLKLLGKHTVLVSLLTQPGHRVNDLHPLHDRAERRILSVPTWDIGGGDEEL